jgi:DNA-directed RNA polymerase specialized sigma24 family protein
MGDAEEFDEFYLATRRRLVLQTLALTGDLGAARTAVRDAFVSARQHWRTVSRLDDPEDWVRPHAWATAQRRHVARIWHREKGIDADQKAVLEALHKLPDSQRKTLLLTHLAALPMAEIAREIGETPDKTERYLQTATSALAVALDCSSTSIRARLESRTPHTSPARRSSGAAACAGAGSTPSPARCWPSPSPSRRARSSPPRSAVRRPRPRPTAPMRTRSPRRCCCRPRR